MNRDLIEFKEFQQRGETKEREEELRTMQEARERDEKKEQLTTGLEGRAQTDREAQESEEKREQLRPQSTEAASASPSEKMELMKQWIKTEA